MSTAPAPTGGLAEKLAQTRAALLPLAERYQPARRALDLLERDLLPRSAGGDSYLVCGVVGPNNAGKSALFNALVGRGISPSVPAGGATRRLVGAAAPDLLQRLRGAPSLARFRWREHEGGSARMDEALETPADPAELIVEAIDTMPANLLLIDTPDFDSILRDNRVASESLLAVADLAIAVVTRHSYQNHEVVRFLEQWLAHGRPWMLLYNEAISEEVARAHAAKLAADVGHAPLALFWAPHSLAVQEGTEALHAQRVAEGANEEALSLYELLRNPERVAEVKTQAFSAAMARLRDDLIAAADELQLEIREAEQILAAAAAHSTATGTEVAASAMPAGPFIDAFRIVLDRRSNFISRSWRSMLRGIRVRVETLGRAIGGRSTSADGKQPGANGLTEIEQRALRQSWSHFWEELVRDLGSEAREPARRACRPEVAAFLDSDLTEARRLPALNLALRALSQRAADLDAFRHACEKLIAEAIEERGFDLDIQAAADLATLAPLALAAAVIVQTGGFGVDLAIAGGGAVGTFLMDKYSHVLGSGILIEARRRWASLRGHEISRFITDAALERSAPALRKTVERESERLSQLRTLAGSMA